MGNYSRSGLKCRSFQMLKRISASLFIVLLAGQVWAGVCGCVSDAKSGMNCCKRSRSETKMRGRSCCGDSCGMKAQSNPPRSQSAQDSFAADTDTPALAPFTVPNNGRRHSVGLDLSKASCGTAHALFARPPNLVIAHHSFRI